MPKVQMNHNINILDAEGPVQSGHFLRGRLITLHYFTLLISQKRRGTNRYFCVRLTVRIHMVTGQSVRVLDYSLLTDVDQDGLPTHRADIIREVFGGHAGSTVVLQGGVRGGRDGNTVSNIICNAATETSLLSSLTPTVEAMKSAHISAKSRPRTP